MTSNGTAPPRPVVTLSTLYGTEEEAIGRRVAERLGVSFLDRDALPSAVAERMNLPEAVVAAHDEQPQGLLDRLTAMLARAPVISQGAPPEPLEAEARRYRVEVERVLARAAASGGVILGRAGTVVLRSVPGVLHVRLTGPRDARVQRVMESESIDKKTAERRVDSNDRARTAYGRDLYGVDPSNVDLYHLVIDSTVLDVSTAVQLIVAASEARARWVPR